MVRIIQAAAGDRAAFCRQVLEELPEWFGIPAAREHYIAEAAILPCFVALTATRDIAGFASLRRQSKAACELHLIAVRKPWQGQGLGGSLLDRVEQDARRRGTRYLTVKTLAPSHPDTYYRRTRRFYARKGFEALEVFPTLWDAENPCLLMLKAL